MRTLKGFLYLILGGTLCGWMFNRIAAWFIDNPLTVGSNHTVAEWAVILQDPFYLDSRTMPFFFLAFGAIALVAMTKYDWTGEREEQKKLRGEEYGNQRWARDDEMQQFAHTSTVKRVPIRIPQRTADAMRFARNNPKDFIKAKLGMTNKVANPKPDYVEKIEDDNIILSERAELQMSKIPDPALERNKHVYVLGGSGSGKTFNFVGPNLLQLNSSIVTTDPKGDTLKQYGNFFLRHGYKLKVVNTKPDQINQSMHYNPLLYLQDSTSIIQIVNLLVENTSGNAEAEKEDFFRQGREAAVHGADGLLLLLLRGPAAVPDVPADARPAPARLQGQPQPDQDPAGHHHARHDRRGRLPGLRGMVSSPTTAATRRPRRPPRKYFVIKQYKGYQVDLRIAGDRGLGHRVVQRPPGAVRRLRGPRVLQRGRAGARYDRRGAHGVLPGHVRHRQDVQLHPGDAALPAVRRQHCHRRQEPRFALQDPDQLHPRRARQHRPHPRPRRQDRDPALALDLHHGHPAIGHAAQEMYKDNADIIEGNCDTTLFLGRCSTSRPNKKISERLGESTATVSATAARRTAGRDRGSESENKIGEELISAADLGNNPEKFGGDSTCIVFVKNTFRFLDKESTDDRPPALTTSCARIGEFNLDDWNSDRKSERERAHRAEVEGDALAHRGGPFVLRPRVLHVGGPRRGRPAGRSYLTRRGGSNEGAKATRAAPRITKGKPHMAFFNQLLNYLWQILTFVGGITAAVGVFRWVSGGKAHDAQAQEGAVWVIALGGAMAAIGLVGGSYLAFPHDVQGRRRELHMTALTGKDRRAAGPSAPLRAALAAVLALALVAPALAALACPSRRPWPWRPPRRASRRNTRRTTTARRSRTARKTPAPPRTPCGPTTIS